MAEHGAEDRADGVVAAKHELYGLPLGQFTAARAERAKQARSAGDRDAAAVIAKLPKPNVAAWLANQLARQGPGELRPLLELGESLRRATADLDAARLGELSRQQRQVVSALTGRARELANEAEQAVSDSTVRGLEETLHAALADEHAAEELIRGQLASGLSRTGFPGLDAAADDPADLAASWGAPVQKPVQPARGKPGGPAGRRRISATGSQDAPSPAGRAAQRSQKAVSDRRAEAAADARRQQLDRAQRAETEARTDAAEADRDQAQARTAFTDAESVARQAEETITRLQDELDAALDARNNAGRAERQARKDAERADRTARQAGRRLAEATARREELERDA
jgi:hypothetical protein